MNDADVLLKKLEPAIDKKCNMIKAKKKEKLKMIYYMVLTSILIILPCILNLLSINLSYYLVSLILIGTLKFFKNLPDILSNDNKGECYE